MGVPRPFLFHHHHLHSNQPTHPPMSDSDQEEAAILARLNAIKEAKAKRKAEREAEERRKAAEEEERRKAAEAEEKRKAAEEAQRKADEEAKRIAEAAARPSGAQAVEAIAQGIADAADKLLGGKGMSVPRTPGKEIGRAIGGPVFRPLKRKAPPPRDKEVEELVTPV